jgi:hypothetical protein
MASGSSDRLGCPVETVVVDVEAGAISGSDFPVRLPSG